MKAWQLLDKPEKWTRGRAARDADGRGTGSTDPEAVQWCMLGAIWHCYGSCTTHVELRDKLVNRLKVEVQYWNDAPGRTHEEVHALLKELDI